MSHSFDKDRNQFDAGRLYRLACKELVEILRDRRTIITLVLMPLLVYPLMGIVVQRLILQSLSNPSQISYNVGFASEDHVEEFSRLLIIGERAFKAAADDDFRKTTNSQDLGESRDDSLEKRIKDSFQPREPELKFFFSNGFRLEQLVQVGDVDLGVSVDTVDGKTVYRLIYEPNNNFSLRALRHVQKRLRYSNEVFTEEIVKASGTRLPLPVAIREVAIESTDQQQPILLTFVPLMLVLMTITGAVYPAIDLTAGERERGTMEILVAAPVSRLVVLIGKFVAVLTVAILTAIANLVAMTVTVYSLGLDQLIFGDASLSLNSLLVIFVLLVVLAAFFSATLLCLTSFARSFKEAQAYLIPLMLVAFAPGLLSLSPSLKTSVFLSIIPLVNIVVSGRDLLSGQANSVYVAISVFSTVMYGLMALSLAARIFGTDSILTGGKSSWSDLWKQAKEKKSVPDVQTATLLLAILFPAFVVLAGLSSNLAGKMDLSVSSRLIVNAAVTGFLFLGLPYLFSVIGRIEISSTFFLYRPSLLAWAAALFLGCSVWVLAYELEIATLTDQRIAQFVEMFEAMKVELGQIPLWVKLVCLALVPAVCEEFTFRGFLLSTFNRRMSSQVAIIVTAVLFGMFHVFVRDTLMFERFVPSTFMGLLLGLVCIRSGSILPGVLLHAVHNGLLITLSHLEKSLAQWGLEMAEQQHLPLNWLLIAAIPISLGLICLAIMKPGGSVNQRRPEN